MAKYNLVHVVPNPRMHGLNGYMDVIESVEWGLTELGHEVGYSLNNFSLSATNIIFGAQVLPVEVLEKLPEDSIVYNFEQICGLQKHQIRKEIHFYSKRFQVWDYSLFNFDAWDLLGIDDIRHVPVGYAPILERIPKPDEQDIDILIYGIPGDKRLIAFRNLAHAGYKIVFVCGLYDEPRDELIARSKIVLNINLYDSSQIFEVVRVSYLLANKKAVVATLDQNTKIEDDLGDAVKYSTLGTLVQDCDRLLTNDMEREQLENTGYERFVSRDIVGILRSALA